MKISSVTISNWRSIQHLTFELDELVVLIGQNNHGKTNIISAILFFFGELKIQEMDFFRSSQDLSVEIEFDQLTAIEKEKFRNYLIADDRIAVKRTGERTGTATYRGKVSRPIQENLRVDEAKNYTTRSIAERLPFFDKLPSSGRITIAQVQDAQRSYVNENVNTIEFEQVLEDGPFLGSSNISKGVFGEVYFIPALRDANIDFQARETSAFGRLYSKVIESLEVRNPAWAQIKTELNSLFSSLNQEHEDGTENIHRPSEITDFEDSISKELTEWNAKLSIEISKPNIESIFRSNTTIYVDDGVKTDIDRKGNGLQRGLTLALIRLIAKRGDQINNCFFIFDEPELFLHPQAQRSLFSSLRELAKGNQVFLCTHSCEFINLNLHRSIFIAYKNSIDEGTRLRYCRQEIFESDERARFKLSYWVNPDRGELFFAKKVILVEGPTEKAVLPRLAKKAGVFSFDFSIIDCAGKASIPAYIKLLNAFRIPYVAVYDRDHQSKKSPDAINASNIATKAILDAIDESIGSAVELNNDIEEELGSSIEGKSKDKPFQALSLVMSEGFKPLEALEGKLKKIFAN